ncbi:MAG: sialidase family protein [Candidatus Dormibacteria bacterium]
MPTLRAINRLLATVALGAGMLAPAWWPAQAADPTSVTVDPSRGGQARATYAGSQILGTDDGGGQLSQNFQHCRQSGPPRCEQETVHVVAPPGWYDSFAVGLKATVTTSDGGGLDVAIFDGAGNLLGSDEAGTSPTSVAVGPVPPGDYIVQVDGDVATGGTYGGLVEAGAIPRNPSPARSAGGLSFGRETIADPFRTGLEPSLLVAADGTVYESPILGFNTTMSFIDRSSDGGETFNLLGAPGTGKLYGTPAPGSLPVCGGGGDIDTASDALSGDLYFADLAEGPYIPAYASHDHGNTFSAQCRANHGNGADVYTDRPWLSTDTVHGRLWFIYREGVLGGPSATDAANSNVYGEYVKWSPLPTAPGTAGPAQLNFTSMCKDAAGLDTTCFGDIGLAGGPVTDNQGPKRGNTYLPFAGGGGVEVAVINPDAPTPVVIQVAAHADRALFPSAAVDRAGNLYVTWSDSRTFSIMLSRSSDQGRTWSTPVRVNGGLARTAVMPWVVAGDAGRVDVVFYASEQDAYPGANYGPWNGYMAQSMNALDANPTFSQARFTDRPSHLDPICLGGLACTFTMDQTGDRRLGEFFKVALDGSGRAVLSFGDTANRLGPEAQNAPVTSPAFAHYVRQATGPSLFRDVAQVPPIPVPTNAVSRAPHDNPVPFTGPTGPGPSVPALNLEGGSMRYIGGGQLEVRMRVRDLDPLAAVGQPPFVGNATFLTRWNFNGQVYYVAAEDNGTAWRYFSGEVQPVPAGGIGALFVAYPAMGPATGSVRPGPDGEIVLQVPAAAVGNPLPKDTLYSVTSYALTQPAPTPTQVTAADPPTLPLVADSLPPYNVEGTAAARTLLGPGEQRWLPTTAAPQSPIFLAALLPVIALLVRRWRRSR